MLPTLRLAALLAALALPTLASDDTINVFIVTHTHDDVGWIKARTRGLGRSHSWLPDFTSLPRADGGRVLRL